MFKNMRLVILFDMFLNPSFKMTTSFTNIARSTLQLGQVNLYTRKNFKLPGIGSLYEQHFLILNEIKTSLMLTLSLQNSSHGFTSLLLTWCDRLPIYGNFI